MFVVINNTLHVINTVKPNAAKFIVAAFNETKNPILVYKCFENSNTRFHTI